LIKELIASNGSYLSLRTGRLSKEHLKKYNKETHTDKVECQSCGASWVEDGYIPRCYRCSGNRVATLHKSPRGGVMKVRVGDDRPVMELIRWEGLPIPNSIHYRTWRILREGFEITVCEGLGTSAWKYTPEEAYELKQLPLKVKAFIEEHLLGRFNRTPLYPEKERSVG
jgi:hypothetical protein